jgi:aerobic carbon-monoxide dehydrogenase large subunit
MSFLAKYIGQKVKRTEDPRLVQGIGHYVDDIEIAGALSVAILRSPYAHARVNSINIDAAKSAPFTPAKTSRARSATSPAPPRCPN